MNLLCVTLLSTFLHLAHSSLILQNVLYSIADSIGTSLSAINGTTDPDWGLNTQEITHKYGYNIDTHETTTEDGYILKIHHLSHDMKNDSNSRRPTVFLMHHITSSSRVWVHMGQKSLGYALVDAGYDVWMGNARGTRYGRSHVRMDPDNDPEFWDFSFDEVGYFDLPAMIDYVLKETNEQNLIFIGYSQGNTAFFDMASRRPEYNDKIKLSVAAGPAVFIGGSQFKILLPFLKLIFETFDIQELFRPGPLIPQLGRLLCSGGETNICLEIYKLLVGQTTNIEPKTMALTACIDPEGFSSKMILHYLQLIDTGEFKRFDYGMIKNIEKYGQLSPPQIDVSKVTAPVALFYTSHDVFVPLQSVKELENTLPHVQLMYKIKSEDFTHADFGFADTRDVLFHAPLLSYLNTFVDTPKNGT